MDIFDWLDSVVEKKGMMMMRGGRKERKQVRKS